MQLPFLSSFWFLAHWPGWVMFPLLMFLSVGILHIGRYYSEGEGFNHSWASEIGDMLLVALVMIGPEVLSRPGVTVPSWITEARFHVAVAGIATIAGVVLTLVTSWPTSKWQTPMDTYHNLVVVPLLLYFGVTAGVLVLAAGSAGERFGAIAFFAGWLVLMWRDAAVGALDQPAYQKRKGITWDGKR